VIEAQGLSRRYGALLAVDNISFSVTPGEVVAFLGPNGAGKSTTLRMLAGFLAPTAGRARLGGHDVVAAPLAARRVLGYLPEGAPGYGELEVAEFLGFIADVRGLRGDARRARLAYVVDRLQLGGVLRQPLETLSKGFRRRVGLAAAILHDPPVLLLDEPTDGLDPNQKYEVRGLIRELARERTILLSTHILEEVEAVCSRALVIARGRLRADATPADLLARSRFHGAVSFAPTDTVAALAALTDWPATTGHERDPADGRVVVFPRQPEGFVAALGERLAARGVAHGGLRVERGRLDDVFRTLTADAPIGEAA
jgi:ABC-2 type transport system ATP-binding protein